MQKKLGTIQRAIDQNSGTIQCANDTKSGTLLRVNDQNLVLWAIVENAGTNMEAFYRHFYIGCLKTQKQQLYFVKIKQNLIFFNLLLFFFKFGQGACKSDRAQASTGRAQRPQK